MEYPFKDLLPREEVTARQGYYKDWSHIDAETFHQISELAKFIREKGHGADTREAIAQALERVYYDASQSGNANMEVSMARGGFDTLSQRFDDTTAQLAQTIQQNKTYIDDQLNNLNGLELKGAYSTLQDLTNAYPNGTQGIFIVQENGHWYYWNGTWSDGGLYQATPWDEFMTENNEEWVI